MENVRFLISENLFLDKASLKEVKQGTSHSISLFLRIFDVEVVSREFLGPRDLMRVQTLCILKLVEIIMISKVKDLMFAAF